MKFYAYHKLILACTIYLGIISCAVSRKQISGYSSQLATIDTSILVDTRISNLLLPYKNRMDSTMNRVIGYSDIPLSKAQPESSLGNLIADAMLTKAKQLDRSVQVSIINYGAIRLPYIAPGPVTRRMIFEVMPFDSKITVLEVPGSLLQEFCNHMAVYGGWPVSGMSYRIKNKSAVEVRVMGKPVSPQLVYTIATLDYVAGGGDNCSFLKDCKRKDYPVILRDVLIDHIEQEQHVGRKLHPVVENRISYGE